MNYLYFIFAGYRVTIGRTNNLKARLVNYRRTHTDVFVLGIILCNSKDDAKSLERDILTQFELSRATTRDLFYLTPEMLKWIVDNTISLSNPKYLEIVEARERAKAQRRAKKAEARQIASKIENQEALRKKEMRRLEAEMEKQENLRKKEARQKKNRERYRERNRIRSRERYHRVVKHDPNAKARQREYRRRNAEQINARRRERYAERKNNAQ